MHIPSSSTQDINILTFDAALNSMTGTGYDRNKWLYVPDYYSEYRYILGTKGSRPLICIGINPSTAAPEDLDNTLKSVARIADNNGFDSWMMFNVYAQRATRPDDMDKEKNEALHAENMKAFEYILKNCTGGVPCIWAAWGAIIEKRSYLYDCVADMIALGEKYSAEWFTAGKRSAAGHPHHPLYLKVDSRLDSFDVKAYMGMR